MPSKHIKRNLTFILALVLVFSLLPASALAVEPEKALDQFQTRIDAILADYGITAAMTEEQLRDAVDAMDWETYQTARWEISELEKDLLASVDAGQLSEAEVQTLIDENQLLCDFFTLLEEKAAADKSVVLYTERTMLDGALTITDTKNSSSVSGTTYTASAKGNLLGAADSTITIKNTSGLPKKVTFTATISGTASTTAPDGSAIVNNGSYEFILANNASVQFYIKSKGGFSASTAQLTLSNVAVEDVAASSNVTFTYTSALGSVTGDGTAISSGTTQEVPSSGMALVATPASGATFIGWVDGDNKVLSTAATYTFVPDKDMSVKAVFAKSGTNIVFGVGTGSSIAYLFDDLNDANTCAAGGTHKTIVLMANGTLPKGDYTISSGVTLLIPYDAAYTLHTTEPAVHSNAYTTPTVYRTLTMASGAKLTVEGALSISGAQSSKMGKNGMPSGPLGFINMKSDSSINVKSGAKLYAWGYITGSGSVEVQSGGAVYECFQVADYRGGDGTSQMVSDATTYHVFPMSQYYLQNVEVPLTLHAGAEEHGHFAVYITLFGVKKAPIPFIGAKGMFNITSGHVVKDYDESTDRLIIDIDSNGTLEVQSFTTTIGAGTLGSVTINSKDYRVPITNNITLNIHSGSTLNVNGLMIMLPGSEVNIEYGATCTLKSGAELVLYDADEWGNYCGASNKTIVPLSYVPGRPSGFTARTATTDAAIRIDGTADATEGRVYTTAGGANIYSTGTGVAKIAPGDDITVYQATQTSDQITGWPSINVSSAVLTNGDGSTVTTVGQTENTTYYYIDGFWYNDRTRIDIVSSNIALNDSLDMYFYVPYADVDDPSKYTAVVTKYYQEDYEDTDRTESVISQTTVGGQWEAYDQEKDGVKDGIYDYYRFKFEGIAAKEMTDKLEAVVYLADGTTQVSNTYEMSVQGYAVAMLNATSDAKLKTTLMDMLEYGAAAQTHFEYKGASGTMANVDPKGSTTLTNNSSSISTANPVSTVALAHEALTGVTVSATNRLMYTFYFTLNSTENLYATVTYQHHKAEAASTYTVLGENFYQRSSTLFGVDVPYMYLVDGFAEIRCDLYDGKGTEDTSDDVLLGYGVDSVAGYAERNQGKSDLYMAMMRFVQSAKTYFS